MRGTRTPRRLSRRRLLTLASAGISSAGIGTLAGCSYRPGGGDVRWESDGVSGFGRPDHLLGTDETLFVLTRSERGFDWETERWGRSARVTAFDASSGSEVWDARPYPIGRPALHQETLFLGHENGDLTAFGADGTKHWQVSVGDFPRTVTASAGRVYALTEAGTLSAFAATDGEQLWTEAVSAGDGGAFTATRNGVVVRHHGDIWGTTIASFGRDGTRRWEAELQAESGVSRGRPVVADGTVYVTTDRGIFVLSEADGTKRWSKQVEHLRWSPVVGDETLYCASNDGIFALDVGDGHTRWSFKPLNRRGIASEPALIDGAVYACASDDLYALSSDDGSVRWQVETGGVTAGPLVVGRTVVVSTEANVVRGHWRG